MMITHLLSSLINFAQEAFENSLLEAFRFVQVSDLVLDFTDRLFFEVLVYLLQV